MNELDEKFIKQSEIQIVSTFISAKGLFNSGHISEAADLLEKVKNLSDRIIMIDPDYKDPTRGMLDLLIGLVKMRASTGESPDIVIQKVQIDVPELLGFIKNEAIEWEQVSPIKSINLHKISIILLFQSVKENKEDKRVVDYLNKEIGEISMRITKLEGK